METKIVMIPADKLWAHPDNPRKALGDLTELTASIRKSGILQNLTVVPWFSESTREPGQNADMGYRVVIGHRRLAAGKAAGLTVFPCVISDMDAKTQLATMMAENLQRSDLTMLEQAEGFQMMLDLGESVKSVAEQTGVAETTVRRRLKLTELDREAVAEAEGRGASIRDYEKLGKLKNVADRNRVLRAIGTKNFDSELSRALDEQKRAELREYYVTELRTFAKQDQELDWRTMTYLKSYSLYAGKQEVVRPYDADTVQYFFKVCNAAIELYREKKEDPGKPAEQATSGNTSRQIAAEARNAKKEPLKEAWERAKKLRADFVGELSEQTAQRNLAALVAWAGFGAFYCRDADLDDLAAQLEEEPEKMQEEEIVETLRGYAKGQPAWTLEQLVYTLVESTADETTWDYDGCFDEDSAEDLGKVYAFLAELGYEISDEEQGLLDGTSELYARDEGDE